MYDNNKKYNIPNNRLRIRERREKLWIFLTRGMKGYEIAKELGVDPSTISRDIQYLTSQSQNYLDSLAKETLCVSNFNRRNQKYTQGMLEHLSIL
jgi:IS30 family transposase